MKDQQASRFPPVPLQLTVPIVHKSVLHLGGRTKNIYATQNATRANVRFDL
jgi:hypothetical protein